MIDTKALADDLSVSAFLPPQRLAELHGRFKTIINNRPDAEEPGQPTSAEIEAEARRLGLAYVHLPVIAGQISDEQVRSFAEALAEHQGPALAFCGTGRRSTMLWALSQAGRYGPEAVLKAAADAGYDLSSLRPRLEEKAVSA